MSKKRVDKNIICTYVAVIVGVLIGCIVLLTCVIYGKGSWLEYGLEDYDVSVMLNVPENEIFFRLLKKRVLQIVLFFCVYILTTFSCSSCLFCAGFGVYYGVVITNLIVKYGIAGFNYGLVCFFPHYLLYFFVIVLCGKWNNQRKNFLNNCYKDMNKLEALIKIFVITFLLSASFFWEIKFQKFFLNYFFQHLV